MLLEIIKFKYKEYLEGFPKRSFPTIIWILLALMILPPLVLLVSIFKESISGKSFGFLSPIMFITLLIMPLFVIPIFAKECNKYRKQISGTEYKEWLDGSIKFHETIKEYISKGTYELLLSQITEEINRFDEINKKNRKNIGFAFGTVYMGIMLAISPVLVEQLFNAETKEMALKALMYSLLPIVILVFLYVVAFIIEKITEKDIAFSIDLQKRIRTLIELSENKYKTHLDKVDF